MDFLGLSTLTLIDDCLEEIKRTEGIELDIDAIPLDDPKTYKVFGEGAAFGIFQFESSGMRDLLRKAKPERLDDLIALNALYRPGPLKSGMVDDWVARKQGRTEVKYELPQLEPILSDTYGVIAYQEQVMRIAQALAGFTLGQADVLRKAMGKKDPKVMAKQREAFMEGRSRQGNQREEGDQDLRPDGVLRRVRVQQVALDGVRLPRLPDRISQGELPVALRGRAADDRSAEHGQARDVPGRGRDRGIPVLPPDINESQLHFSVEPGQGVRFGLTAIKGLGEGAIRAILDARARLGGRIPSLHALCEELDLRIANKRVFEALVKAGACDSLVGSTSILRCASRSNVIRARLFAAIDGACEHGNRLNGTRISGRSTCSAATRDNAGPTIVPLPDVPPWSGDRATDLREGNARTVLDRTSDRSIRRRPSRVWRQDHGRSRAQARARGGGHRRGGEDAAGEAMARPENGNGASNGRVAEDISIGGIVSGLRPLKTRKGDRMCVFTLDDAGGSIEVVVSPKRSSSTATTPRTAAGSGPRAF